MGTVGDEDGDGLCGGPDGSVVGPCEVGVGEGDGADTRGLVPTSAGGVNRERRLAEGGQWNDETPWGGDGAIGECDGPSRWRGVVGDAVVDILVVVPVGGASVVV